MRVRPVEAPDVETIQAIYAHHVLNGSGTFEEEPPTVFEIRQRIIDVQDRKLPWLVAEEDGQVVAYAYAGPFRLRSAYRFTAETSVYVSADRRGQGIGRLLLSEILDQCRAVGVRQMLAMIGDSSNTASIALHRSLGFDDVGTFRDVGFKADRWLDVVAMQLSLENDVQHIAGGLTPQRKEPRNRNVGG